MKVNAYEMQSTEAYALQEELCSSPGLWAGTWVSHVQYLFYVRDVTYKSMDTFSLGPGVAIQEAL